MSGQSEAKSTKQLCQPCNMRLIDGKLDERHTRDGRSGAQCWDYLIFSILVVEQHKGAHAVDRDLLSRLSAELVIEDFERQRSLVSSGIYRLHKIPDRKVALSGKTAKVPAPRENIEFELRSICELNEEDTIPRDRSDRSDRKRWSQSMETIQNNPDGVVVDSPNDFPGVSIIVDVTSPRQSLESDS